MEKLTCIICPRGCSLEYHLAEDQYEIIGHECPRGKEYAFQELTNPLRSLQSTVKTTIAGQRRASVKTSSDVPLKDIFLYMDEINKVVISEKKACGDIIAYGLCGSDVNLILTQRLK